MHDYLNVVIWVVWFLKLGRRWAEDIGLMYVVVLLLGKVDQPACIYFGIGLIGKFLTKCTEFDANFGI